MALAQELTEQPRMANHARGLWGYHGVSSDGRELTVQATGIGGHSAVAVLADLAELGVRRALRVGACVGGPGTAAGEVLTFQSGEAGRVGVLPALPRVPRPDGHVAWDTQTSDLLAAATGLGIELEAALVVAETGDGVLPADALLTACATAAQAFLNP